MVPKVLVNPEFSFGEVTKTVTDMREHLDDICKKELSQVSKTGTGQSHVLMIMNPTYQDKEGNK